MATNQNPTDVARETLKLLAVRRVAPTPENYQRIYHEIAGEQAEGSPGTVPAERVVGALRDIATAYPANAALSTLAAAAARGDLQQFNATLSELANARNGARHDWAPVIRE